MLTLTVKEKEIVITEKEDFIRGTVGAKCEIIFESFWDKYYKNIIFKRVSNGCATSYRVLIDNLVSEIDIPYEVLEESGAFIIGAYGTTENEVLPTLWSEEIKVLYGTTTNGENAEKYTPSEIEQLRMSKQDKLTAGNGIEIEGNVISATGGGGGTADFQLFANALKGTLEGDYLFTNDVSPLKHELKVNLTSDTITDFSSVKVSRYGKNLFPIGKDYWEREIGDFTFDDEGVYGKHGDGASNFAMFTTKYPSGTYSFSAEFSYDGSKRILARCFDADGNIITSGLSNYNAFYKAFIIPVKDVVTFTIPDTVAYWQLGWVSNGETIGASVSMKFPQLELGASVTPYEQCVVHTATANADGTVEGLTSVSPYMVLLTDNPSVLINCTYNRDINKISGNVDLSNYYTKTEIDNKFDEIKTLLGDIETLLGGI